jgi:hypothetical protein
MAVLPIKNTAGGLPQRCHSSECVTDCIVTFSFQKINTREFGFQSLQVP